MSKELKTDNEDDDDAITTVRYVIHKDVDRYVDDGWQIKSLQSHHSRHAVLAVKKGIHDDPPTGA